MDQIESGDKLMRHDNQPVLQQTTVDKVLGILKGSPHVLACFLWGSMAADANDAYSDIDLICFLDSEEKVGREELFREVGKLYPLLCDLYLYDKYALYLFENGIRLDLDFYKPSEVKEIDRSKAKVLYDPKSFVAEHLVDQAHEASPRPAWHDNEGDFAEWFLWMFRQTYNWCRRAEQGTYKSFDKLLGAYNSVYEVRNKLLDVKRFLMDEREYLQKADPAFTERMAKTFPGFTSQSVLDANNALLKEYEQLLPVYCRKVGKTYPAEKVQRLKMLIYLDKPYHLPR